jgi:hypothetical protein
MKILGDYGTMRWSKKNREEIDNLMCLMDSWM